MRLPIAGWTVASCGPDSPQPENEEIHKGQAHLNPEKPDVPLNKNDAFKKYKNDAYKKNGERGPILHDQSPPFFFHLNPLKTTLKYHLKAIADSK